MYLLCDARPYATFQHDKTKPWAIIPNAEIAELDSLDMKKVIVTLANRSCQKSGNFLVMNSGNFLVMNSDNLLVMNSGNFL